MIVIDQQQSTQVYVIYNIMYYRPKKIELAYTNMIIV